MENLKYKIVVTREKNELKQGGKLKIFLDGEKKCELLNGETKVLLTNKTIVNLQYNQGAMSPKHVIDFSEHNAINVYIKPGSLFDQYRMEYVIDEVDDNNLNKLSKLNDLKNAGDLSEDEYKLLKQKVINDISNNININEKSDMHFDNKKYKIVAYSLSIIMLIIAVIIVKSVKNPVETKTKSKEDDILVKTVETLFGAPVQTMTDEELLSYDKEVSIKELTKTYYDNEVNGNKQYLGKRVKVSGIIDHISVDDAIVLNQGISITLTDSKAYYRLFCNFGEGNSKGITDYIRGDRITIIGEVKGKGTFASILLDKCIIDN